MFSKELEELIEASMADGTLSDVERRVIHKRAAAEGVDPDELDVIIDGRLVSHQKQQAALRPDAQQQTTPAPNNGMRYGNVMKCPNCAAQVVSGSAVCHECGFAFTNVNVVGAAEKLQERLDDFNRRQQSKSAFVRAFTGADIQAMQSKLEIISTFPVPNTRGDLLDLLTMVEPRINIVGPKNGVGNESDSVTSEDLSYGYWLLFANCINKARISFANDEAFTRFFARYDEENNRTKGFSGWWLKRRQKG